MFEILKIELFGIQPVANVTDKTLERLILRDFGNKKTEVMKKLGQVISDTHKGKNRISADIIKLANKDLQSIDNYIDIGIKDFRDVIFQAEYPRLFKLDFSDIEKQNKKQIYRDDWTEYKDWLSK
jgi:hypothetical protein